MKPVEYLKFLTDFEGLEMWEYTIWSAWYIFLIETKTEKKKREIKQLKSILIN